MAKKVVVELEVDIGKWFMFTRAVKSKYGLSEPREFLKRVCGIAILWMLGEKKDSASELLNNPDKLYSLLAGGSHGTEKNN